jgi:UDP-N-acetylmuramyl pentapeptide phosphotransferase/UDP-N-acetylglucosamine-1-phosphate transferase
LRLSLQVGLWGLAFAISLLGCFYLRSFALRRSLVDVPNERSLHAVPVPRIGGVALCVAVWVCGAAAFAITGEREILVWLLLAVPVFVVGLVDDLRPVSAGVRFGLQIAVAVAFVVAVGLPSRFCFWPGATLAVPAALSYPLAVIWIVGVVNIYNFMDGMDGIAAVQAVGAAVALSVGLSTHHAGLAFVAASFVAAAAGFFVHNAPKARIFLGDAGSTVLGFTFATFPLVGSGDGSVPVLAGPVALAPFLLDGTFTLIRRARRGEKVWQAHRTHLYQRAVATGLTHGDVLLRYAAWTAVAMGASIVVQRGTGRETAAAVGAVLLGLFLVWRWVVSREHARAA